MYGEKRWKDLNQSNAEAFVREWASGSLDDPPSRLSRFFGKLGWAGVFVFIGFVLGYTMAYHHFVK